MKISEKRKLYPKQIDIRELRNQIAHDDVADDINDLFKIMLIL